MPYVSINISEEEERVLEQKANALGIKPHEHAYYCLIAGMDLGPMVQFNVTVNQDGLLQDTELRNYLGVPPFKP